MTRFVSVVLYVLKKVFKKKATDYSFKKVQFEKLPFDTWLKAKLVYGPKRLCYYLELNVILAL
jgi:hypothetical protein